MKTIEKQLNKALDEYELALIASQEALDELESMKANDAPSEDIRRKARIYFEVLKPQLDSAKKVAHALRDMNGALIPIRKDIIRYKAVVALSVVTSCVYWGVNWFQ